MNAVKVLALLSIASVILGCCPV